MQEPGLLIGNGESTTINTNAGSNVGDKELVAPFNSEALDQNLKPGAIESERIRDEKDSFLSPGQWEPFTLDFSRTVWRNTRTNQLFTFPTATSFAEKKEYLENILANEKEFEVSVYFFFLSFFLAYG
jgi:hypothetical protein